MGPTYRSRSGLQGSPAHPGLPSLGGNVVAVEASAHLGALGHADVVLCAEMLPRWLHRVEENLPALGRSCGKASWDDEHLRGPVCIHTASKLSPARAESLAVGLSWKAGEGAGWLGGVDRPSTQSTLPCCWELI